MFDSPDVQFWQTKGVAHLHVKNFKEFYEGEDTVRAIAEIVGLGSVRDIGCGYGRLATLFDPNDYVGYDICPAAIDLALKARPSYRFFHWNFSPLAFAKTTMFINGPSLINDNDIDRFISIICSDTEAVVLGEIMCHDNLQPVNFKIYRRTVEEYDDILASRRLLRTRTYQGTHEYSSQPYTVARWEK